MSIQHYAMVLTFVIGVVVLGTAAAVRYLFSSRTYSRAANWSYLITRILLLISAVSYEHWRYSGSAGINDADFTRDGGPKVMEFHWSATQRSQ
jgi:hypothetical protein